MSRPSETTREIGYAAKPYPESSGSQSLKSEMVKRLVPLTNTRQLFTTLVLPVPFLRKVYPISKFFRRINEPSLSHQLED